MPTGYTHKIKEGQSFEDFVIGCARAFGATITMRDEPSDAPIPDEFKPSTYNIERLEKLDKELDAIRTMSDEELDEKAQKEYDDALKRYNEKIEEDKLYSEKLNEMLQKTEEWEPPTDEHIEMKKFMVSQIKDTINFDLGYEPTKPTKKTGKELFLERIESINEDIKYNKKEHEKEVERSEGRTEWVRALKESLKETTDESDECPKCKVGKLSGELLDRKCDTCNYSYAPPF